MKKVELWIMPYASENGMKTRLIVDGNTIDSKDNRLTNLVAYQPMWKWLNPYKKKLFVWDGLLAEIIEEFNDMSIHFVFRGCKADYIMFRKNILKQQMKLNRNGGAVDVAFEFADIWNPQRAVKELADILADLRIEADKWGEDDIIKEINAVKRGIDQCNVALKTEYYSSPAAFQSLLQRRNIAVKSDSFFTVIPVDGGVRLRGIRDYIAALAGENGADGKYLVVNTSAEENEPLFEAVAAFDSGNDSNIKYIENDDDNYIQEIEKIYYLSVLPDSIRRTIEILHLFPDYDTNNYLIDISDRINDLFRNSLK